jgi:hypothetical protein
MRLPRRRTQHGLLLHLLEGNVGSLDLVNTLIVFQDLSQFHNLADSAQQGFLNFIFLGRALMHADGFASHPAFRDEGGSLLDGSHLFYDGNSQGGIMGGALAAVSPTSLGPFWACPA